MIDRGHILVGEVQFLIVAELIKIGQACKINLQAKKRFFH